MKQKQKPPPLRRPKAGRNSLRVGVGWYTEDEWVRVKSAAVDPERFEDTYGEWLEMAECALADLRAIGNMPRSRM